MEEPQGDINLSVLTINADEYIIRNRTKLLTI